MKTYAERRYSNANLRVVIAKMVDDMHSNPSRWDAPTKTLFKRKIQGQELAIARNYYSHDEPVQLFVNQVEIEDLTEKETRILRAEFGYLREKFANYISKNKERNKSLFV